MNLTEAREVVRDSVLHTTPDSYPAAQVDRAIKFVLTKFARKTRCCRTTVEVDTTANVRTIDIASAANLASKAGFYVEGAINAYIDFHPVTVDNYAFLSQTIVCNPTKTGRPCSMAFASLDAVASLYPLPDDVYTLLVNYAGDLVDFTVGTDTPDSVELNVPDRFIHDALWLGGGPALVYGEPETPWTMRGWQKFEQYMVDVLGEITVNPGIFQLRDSLE